MGLIEMNSKIIKSLFCLLLLFSSFNVVYGEEPTNTEEATIEETSSSENEDYPSPIVIEENDEDETGEAVIETDEVNVLLNADVSDNETLNNSQTAEYNSSYGFFLSIANDETRSELERQNAKFAAEYLANWADPDYYAEHNKKTAFADGITHIGQEGDATTIENMLIALNMIDECNRLRTTDDLNPGLSELKVNLILMASAQISTNAENQYVGHFSQTKGSSANAQWGIRGDTEAGIQAMYNSYYTSEKAYVEFIHKYEAENPAPDRETDGDEAYETWYNEMVAAAKAAGAYPKSSTGSTGYYWNIVRESSTINGAAYNSTTDGIRHYNDGQVFNGDKLYYKLADGTENNQTFNYTTSELRALLLTYIKPIKFTLIYDANEGVLNSSSKNLHYGDEYGELPTPTREGYSFEGWYTSTTGGEQVTSTSIMGASNKTIYAHWTKSVYTSTMNPNGGFVYPTSRQLEHGDQYGELPTPQRVGYHFAGWFTDIRNDYQVDCDTVMDNQDTTIYAHWNQNEVTITFDTQNEATIDYTSKTIKNGDPCGELPVPTKTGWTFLCWFTKAGNYGEQVTESTIINEDTKLYAHWKVNQYTVTYDANGGVVSPTTMQVNYSSSFTFLIPTREGHKYLGWFTKAEGDERMTRSSKVTQDMTVYAHWSVNSYRLTYDANGGLYIHLVRLVHTFLTEVNMVHYQPQQEVAIHSMDGIQQLVEKHK